MATNQLAFTKAVLDQVLAAAPINPSPQIMSIHVRPGKVTYTLKLPSGLWTRANANTIFALLAFLESLNGKTLVADKTFVLGPLAAAPAAAVPGTAPATGAALAASLQQLQACAVWLI